MMESYQQTIEKAAEVSLPWERLSGKNILVLGATGLIGSTVVDVLMNCVSLDFDVYACGRNEQRAQQRFAAWWTNPRFHFLRHDVTQPWEWPADFHFIIDAASGASPQLYTSDPVGIIRANILGVDRLLDEGRKRHLEKFVYVSSGEVYGEGDGRPFTEDYSGYVDPMSVRSCYPSSKRAAETLCVAYGQEYGLDVSVARPSHVYGPYFTESDNRVYAEFIRNVLRGEDIVMKSDGKKFRSWCYVVDCALALLFILLKGENGKAYNIADESSNRSIRDLAEMIAAIGGRKVRIELPKDAAATGGTPITKAVFDTSRLRSLGWQITGTMEEKMSATINEAAHALKG
ncbi:NAD-dependent epimerase/dehydratase family protein [Prevotella sp. AGR2160]|uniref:NAD-dependent epimerase/dehydratase family protein n=1 Tax=Prevotella sp. AGR2160 TaxID=1280674 RepID=UPI0009DC22FF|nr:NAD-dependent epimerase/dehydratase family protein [Prevotella sp. AGR2160]